MLNKELKLPVIFMVLNLTGILAQAGISSVYSGIIRSNHGDMYPNAYMSVQHLVWLAVIALFLGIVLFMLGLKADGIAKELPIKKAFVLPIIVAVLLIAYVIILSLQKTNAFMFLIGFYLFGGLIALISMHFQHILKHNRNTAQGK